MKTKLLLYLSFLLSITTYSQEEDTIRCYFDFDKAIVINTADSVFQNLINKKNNSLNNLELFAYTDTIGSIDYNKQLAQRRLNSVLTHIDTNHYSVITHVIGETSSMQLKQNRRVEICFTYPTYGEEFKPKGDTVILDIQFYNNSPMILPKSLPELETLLNYVLTHPEMNIELHGHVCCGPGYDLSFARALSVKRYLIENAIDEKRIQCYGHSNDQPRVKETSSDNEQLNRRVECVFRNKE